MYHLHTWRLHRADFSVYRHADCGWAAGMVSLFLADTWCSTAEHNNTGRIKVCSGGAAWGLFLPFLHIPRLCAANCTFLPYLPHHLLLPPHPTSPAFPVLFNAMGGGGTAARHNNVYGSNAQHAHAAHTPPCQPTLGPTIAPFGHGLVQALVLPFGLLPHPTHPHYTLLSPLATFGIPVRVRALFCLAHLNHLPPPARNGRRGRRADGHCIFR